MNIKNIIQSTENRKTVRMYIKTTPIDSKWMKDKEISPQLLFDEALKEIQMEKRQ